MGRFIATFLVTLALFLGLVALGPLPPEWSTQITLGSLVAFGAVAALVGRGPSGLLAFYLGYGAAYLLAVALGRFLPPSESEVMVWLVYQAIFLTTATLGYLGPVLVRALLRRRRPPT